VIVVHSIILSYFHDALSRHTVNPLGLLLYILVGIIQVWNGESFPGDDRTAGEGAAAARNDLSKQIEHDLESTKNKRLGARAARGIGREEQGRGEASHQQIRDQLLQKILRERARVDSDAKEPESDSYSASASDSRSKSEREHSGDGEADGGGRGGEGQNGETSLTERTHDADEFARQLAQQLHYTQNAKAHILEQ